MSDLGRHGGAIRVTTVGGPNACLGWRRLPLLTAHLEAEQDHAVSLVEGMNVGRRNDL
jgi:hypothetical protein